MTLIKKSSKQINANRMIRKLEKINNLYLEWLTIAKTDSDLRQIAIGWDVLNVKNIELAAKQLDDVYKGITF